MKKKIPNFNTLSTCIDRLIIEEVKLALFSAKMQDEGVDYLREITTQKNLIISLKKELTKILIEAYKKGYSFENETRTFS